MHISNDLIILVLIMIFKNDMLPELFQRTLMDDINV